MPLPLSFLFISHSPSLSLSSHFSLPLPLGLTSQTRTRPTAVAAAGRPTGPLTVGLPLATIPFTTIIFFIIHHLHHHLKASSKSSHKAPMSPKENTLNDTELSTINRTEEHQATDLNFIINPMYEQIDFSEEFRTDEIFETRESLMSCLGWSRNKFGEVMDEIIKEHQERTAKRKYSTEDDESGEVEDLVDVLLRIKDDEQQLEVPLTVDNIIAVIFTTSRRLADKKISKFQKNITKRGSVPETTTKKGNDYPVGPIVLGFFIFVVIGSYVVIGVKRRLERARLKFDEMMDEMIKEHQERTAKRNSTEDEESGGVEDLVDVLLRIKDEEQLEVPLTVDNIKAVIFDMFSGGTETTSTTLTWAMAELVNNPKVMKKVQMEVRQILKGKAKIHEDDISGLQYLKLVIKETLRLHPPLPLLLPRACGETCEVGGFTIPSGARVMINVWALGRDTGVWNDAEIFRPERFDGSSVDFKGADHYGYLPFGSGRRTCPGITFGLATVELVLAKLLYHFNWELPDGMKLEDLDMTDIFGVTARKTHDLYLHAKLVHAW